MSTSHLVTASHGAHASAWLGPHVLDALECRGYGVLYLSEEGRVMYCNISARKLLSLHHAQVIGAKAQDLNLSEILHIDIEQIHTNQRIALRSAVSLGESSRVDATLFPVRTGPVCERGLVVLLRPLTERDEYLAQIGQEYAQSCHDCLNQLGALKAWTSLMKSKGLSKDQEQDCLDEMLRGIDSFEKSLQSVLMPLQNHARQRLHVEPLVEKAWSKALAHWPEPLTCTLRLESSHEQIHIGSQEEVLVDCLVNIFRNSMRIARDGWIYCWIDLADPWVLIRIADGGAGPDDSDFVFLNSHLHQGCGLGLSSLQQKILSLGGSVDLEKDPDGKGTLILRVPKA